MKIAFLTCHDLLQDAPARRADAFEHDLQFAALREGLAGRADVAEIDWRSPIGAFKGFDVAVLGTAWDYQDRAEEFIARLDDLAACGVDVRNSPEVARWNIEKTICKASRSRARRRSRPYGGTIRAKRTLRKLSRSSAVIGSGEARVGAGAYGQCDFTRAALRRPVGAWDGPASSSRFLPSIVSEGEYSVIFIGGEHSHTLVKRAAPGDYRIQSLHGGVESPATLGVDDMRDARAVYAALPFDDLLYARIDMVRGRTAAFCSWRRNW